jgi:pimeloyl-ACP methyl ester carboxylesterase
MTATGAAPTTFGRTLFIAALAALLAIAALASPAAAKRTLAADRPTIVLVHGAWADEAAWNEVVPKLHKDGYATVTPRLGLVDAGVDVATVDAALDSIPGKKILVGHSYAGWVITNAAYGRSDVLGLVYTAAYVPDQGDTVLSLGDGYAPPAALPDLLWTGAPFASLAYIDPARFRDDFAQDLSPKEAAVLSDHQQAIAFPIFVTPSGPAAWHSLPSWFAISGADRMVDPALQRAEAIKIHATKVVFDDASHAGGFTHYATRFAKLIEQAAEATAG